MTGLSAGIRAGSREPDRRSPQSGRRSRSRKSSRSLRRSSSDTARSSCWELSAVCDGKNWQCCAAAISTWRRARLCRPATGTRYAAAGLPLPAEVGYGPASGAVPRHDHGGPALASGLLRPGRGRRARVHQSHGCAAAARNFYRRVWVKARELVGLPGVHFHDLRHTGNSLTEGRWREPARADGAYGPQQHSGGLGVPARDGERQRAFADAVGKVARSVLRQAQPGPPHAAPPWSTSAGTTAPGCTAPSATAAPPNSKPVPATMGAAPLE
jgi:hypothetical protein